MKIGQIRSQKIDMGVVYGLHHKQISISDRQVILKRWFEAVKNMNKSASKTTVITISSSNRLTMEDIAGCFQEGSKMYGFDFTKGHEGKEWEKISGGS